MILDVNKLSNKRFLGDSVYAGFDGMHIVLYTDNGYGPENVIYILDTLVPVVRDYFDQIFPQPGSENYHYSDRSENG